MSNDPRIPYARFNQIAAPARQALLALGKAVDDTGLEKDLTELVKLRVSQINGCAFCLALHLDIARQLKVPGEKLDLVAVWREAGIFSAREMAALAWTEALTLPASNPDLAGLYGRLREVFDETESAHLTIAIGTINQWNRIAIGLGFAPVVAKAQA